MYVFLACVAAALAFSVFLMWKRTKEVDKLTRLTLPEWSNRYEVFKGPEKVMLARSFIEQSLHLAHQLGAMPTDRYTGIRKLLRTEDPVRLVEGWMRGPYYSVIEAIGQREAWQCEARLIGALMLISMSGVDPVGDVRRFAERMASA